MTLSLFPRFLNGRIQVNIDIVEMLTEKKKDADLRHGNVCAQSTEALNSNNKNNSLY